MMYRKYMFMLYVIEEELGVRYVCDTHLLEGMF